VQIGLSAAPRPETNGPVGPIGTLAYTDSGMLSGERSQRVSGRSYPSTLYTPLWQRYRTVRCAVQDE